MAQKGKGTQKRTDIRRGHQEKGGEKATGINRETPEREFQ